MLEQRLFRIRGKPTREAKIRSDQDRVDYQKACLRIEEYVNRRAFEDRSEVQVFAFANIATDLALPIEWVRSALVGGGHNGMTVKVTEAQREELARRFSQSSNG